MITIIRDDSVEETSYRSFLGRVQKIRQNHIEKIQIDDPKELELANLGAAHQGFKSIDGVIYEPVHSDNLYRLKNGERAEFIDERSWLPVKKTKQIGG